jgi:spore coat protein U-like protein
MKQRLLLSAACALALGVTVPTADAAPLSTPVNASFNVTLTVRPECTISVAGMHFTTVGVFTNPQLANTNVSVTCTRGTPFNVGLDGGNVSGSSVNDRTMKGTGTNPDLVHFQLLCQDPQCSATNWGNTQGTDTFSGVGGGTEVIQVTGTIAPPASPLTPDNYSTTITATVWY